jgi:hypothetical protein
MFLKKQIPNAQINIGEVRCYSSGINSRARLTAPGASELYPSAPISSANFCVTGAPPMRIFTSSPSSLQKLKIEILSMS